MTNNLLLLIILAVMVMLLLAVAIILFVVYYQKRITTISFQREKELTEAAIHAEEDERTRIAAELHDDVGATLSSIKLFLQVAEKEEGERQVFTRSQALIDDAIAKLRSISHRLQPAILLRMGLQNALQSFFEVFNKTGGIHIEYTSNDLPDDLDENIALAAYRIVQELLNNTLKHAAATHAEVYTEIAGNALTICYSHNGKGITEELFNEYLYKKNATGLKNIVNRLKMVSGTITFEQEEHWYHTIVTIPL